MNICNYVEDLIRYAEEKGMIEACDRVYATNRLLEVLKLSDYAPEAHEPVMTLEDILGALCDYAVANGLCEDSVVYRDLFDTSVMGQITPRPSEVIRKFDALYAISPEEATDYFISWRATATTFAATVSAVTSSGKRPRSTAISILPSICPSLRRIPRPSPPQSFCLRAAIPSVCFAMTTKAMQATRQSPQGRRFVRFP